MHGFTPSSDWRYVISVWIHVGDANSAALFVMDNIYHLQMYLCNFENKVVEME